ncbi:MAG: DNA mismatch repair protein MutS, partial [Clostridia bacterium]|nr:DNA mismatch repair protein MutS [Clostridia bacterium]
EVTNSFKSMVPEDYIRKQTLTNVERYITQELKDLENRIIGAHDRALAIEGQLFDQVRKTVAAELVKVQETAKAIAELDVINSFAMVAAKYDYTRPTITMNGRISIKDGRHPVVEALMKSGQFVPNDTELDMNTNRMAIITGPNMAGKSTYMRQVAIIVIMAQIGSFVPASHAEIGIVDSVFTRVGASDDLAAGQSTFMIEMSEVADILKNATQNSLIILDEIGRGTSTYDGMSIARAVIEYIHEKKNLGAKTLFATHYHELTELEDTLPGVKNYNIAVKKNGDDITFLRKILPGGADDSFGIQVAKLAGVPDKVLNRAKQVLQSLEEGTELKGTKKVSKRNEEPVQLTMNTADNAVIAKIKSLDVNSMTPIQCMNALFEIANLLGK